MGKTLETPLPLPRSRGAACTHVCTAVYRVRADRFEHHLPATPASELYRCLHTAFYFCTDHGDSPRFSSRFRLAARRNGKAKVAVWGPAQGTPVLFSSITRCPLFTSRWNTWGFERGEGGRKVVGFALSTQVFPPPSTAGSLISMM